jgi:hypothetical protein
MSTQIQYRRGSSAQTASFTGALGEITVDTTNRVVVVHDGATLGGFSGVGTTATQTLTNKTLQSAVLTGSLTAGGGTGSSGQFLTSTGTGVAWATVDATSIANGTSSMTVIASGGNIRANVGGVTNTTFTATEANVSANLSVQGFVGLGTAPTTAAVTIGGNETASSWTTSGIGLRINAATYTDSSTAAAGTAATNHIHAIAQGTLAATNGSVTTTNASTLFIAGAPVAGTNMTISNRWALFVAGGNSGFGGDILNLQANGTGNIGSSTTGFNTVFARATSAQYADVAERYLSDADYPIGTVLVIGGDKEVTQSTELGQSSIAGTVSENPGVLMNRGLEGEHVVPVALIGRVPCRVVGKIAKGDLLTSSEVPGVACKMKTYVPGSVIGKALEAYSGNAEGLIEIMVGRL